MPNPKPPALPIALRLALSLPALALLAACNMPPDQRQTSSAVVDPYVSAPGGGAVYRGNVNRAGSHLPGTPAPQLDPGPQTAAIAQAPVHAVAFARDSASLTPQSREQLAAQAQQLLADPGASALIEGHADEDGTRDYNLALGARRANAVREYLALRGVEQSRIRTISYGKERPLEACTTEACRDLNRRAVTTITPGVGV